MEGFPGCSMVPLRVDARSELFEGGYYSVVDGDCFGVAKLLKLEPDQVHIRVFKQRFASRPRSVDLDQLTLGTIHDTDGIGAGHVPLRLATFRRWKPVFLTYSEVKPDELEGYNAWKDSNGGVWQ
jgi:hypothetical protein